MTSDQLRRIEAVTDAGLAHLEVEELYIELLDRVRELLSVDTAAVLLLGPSKRYVEAVAARGLEEEVRQGVRIPLGRGFAGRIAAQKQPVVIEHVSHSDVLNPILRDKGIRSLLGVPLLCGGELVGVLHVGTLTPRRFADADVQLLQLVADRVALAAQATSSKAERTAANVLQRSLLPSDLPIVPGLEFAARYVPGGNGRVGGDWYDVIHLPSGWLCIVVGDVVGCGLPAAVTMGRLRSTVYAYVLESHDPADLLTRLDRQLQYFQPDVMATALCAMVEPSHDRMLISSAGHPPPIAAMADRSTAFVTLRNDLPLGVDGSRGRSTSTVAFPPGAAVGFYTDGLVERRGISLDVGLDRLRRAMFAGPPDSVCARVMLQLIGGETVRDDVALLVLRRSDGPSHEPLDITEPAVPSSLRTIRNATRQWLTGVGAEPDEIGDVLVAVGEACTNVIEHAYGPRGGSVSVHLTVETPHVVATVCDTGRWRPAHGRNRGRGVLLMKGLADEVRIERKDTGTEVLIRKALAGEGWR
ncbi:ATP-binding SpoIIE family protein phosphatase [Pseudonocardia asaccharolytica]|uniref:ATP-binding SpoIIE family protein phosphatase n=1 Tax=Pseudonocardia asaccharolytica TaxID=54010 RepID=UPI00041D229A|nr:SpoIIE family protein phosphatase [Pseudonocardia asaccharolytica]